MVKGGLLVEFDLCSLSSRRCLSRLGGPLRCNARLTASTLSPYNNRNTTSVFAFARHRSGTGCPLSWSLDMNMVLGF